MGFVKSVGVDKFQSQTFKSFLNQLSIYCSKQTLTSPNTKYTVSRNDCNQVNIINHSLTLLFVNQNLYDYILFGK